MKKNKKIIMLLLVLLVTGCTKYKQINKTPVINDQTGQRVIENLLCKTEKTEKQYHQIKEKYMDDLEKNLQSKKISKEEFDKQTKELDNEFNLDEYQNCNNFKVFSGEEGLWTTMFVKTLSWIIIKLGNITKNYGWAIILVTILIRMILFPITQKTARQSENLNAAKSKLDKLEKKYKDKTDQQSQMLKAQEMMIIYKEYNINPFAGCIFAFIQIPLFFAFYEALYRLPVILEENFFGINLGITPSAAFAQGNYYYIIFVVLVVLATYFSFKLNSTMNLDSEQGKQMKLMMYMSIVMISIASFTISTGIALYWITNSTFTIIQNILVKRSSKNVRVA